MASTGGEALMFLQQGLSVFELLSKSNYNSIRFECQVCERNAPPPLPTIHIISPTLKVEIPNVTPMFFTSIVREDHSVKAAWQVLKNSIKLN